MAVALGHSGATAWETRGRRRRRAQMVTHIFNAMAPFHHREPGLAGAALTDERLMVSVIADNVHVAAPARELVRRAAGRAGGPDQRLDRRGGRAARELRWPASRSRVAMTTGSSPARAGSPAAG